MTTRAKNKGLFGLACLVFLVSFCFALRGGVWSTMFHPDEAVVAKWMEESLKRGHIHGRVYPEGWFQLAKIATEICSFSKKIVNAEDISRWINQDGAVMATKESSFKRIPPSNAKEAPYISFGRGVNLVLNSLAAVLVFLTCCFIGVHPFAAVSGALFLAFSPFAIEFSHYCETDTGLVFSLALAFCLSVVAIKRRSIPIFIVSSLACGFAISCKYTLMPIVAVPVAVAAQVFRGNVRKCAILTIVAIVAMLAGFVLGSPTLYQDPGFFFESASSISNATYHETTAMLGQFANLKWARAAFKIGTSLEEGSKLGIIGIAWGVLSFCFWSHAKYRKYATVIPIFIGTFSMFICFGMPWMRRQELLPFVVAGAVTSSLAIDWAMHSFKNHLYTGICLTVFAVIAIGSTFADGLRMSSAFQRREMRAESQNWFTTVFPADELIAADPYSGVALRGSTSRPVSVGKKRAAEHYPEVFIDSQSGECIRYYLRNESMFGRDPIRHPLTRNLLPEYQRKLDSFYENCVLLKTWRTADGRIRPTFPQVNTSLWYIPAEEISNGKDVIDVPLRCERPIVFRESGVAMYGSACKYPIGPTEAIHTVGRRGYAVPPICNGPVWAVSRAVSGRTGSKIAWNRFFYPAKQSIGVGGAAAALLNGNEHMAFTFWDCLPRARVRMRGDDQGTLCFTSFETDPAEVAYLLRRHGEPENALQILLSNGDGLSTSGKVEAFLCSAAAGIEPRDDWRDCATAALNNYEKAMLVSGADGLDGIGICGLPATVMDDFARIRIPSGEIQDGLPLHVFLTPGEYRVSVVKDGFSILSTALSLSEGQLVRSVSDLFSEADIARIVEGAYVIIQWDCLARLAREADEIRAALRGGQPRLD